MTHLDKNTIRSLSKLSRIRCTEEEEEAILKDLKKILSYIDQLNEIDTENVAPCNHVIPEMVNVFRPDEVGEIMPRSTFLDNAPSQIGGLIRTPPVIKSNN